MYSFERDSLECEEFAGICSAENNPNNSLDTKTEIKEKLKKIEVKLYLKKDMQEDLASIDSIKGGMAD